MAKTNDLVKFYRGSEELYVSKWETTEGKQLLTGALFFDASTQHIWYDGVQYGVNVSSDLGDYATQQWVSENYDNAFFGLSTGSDNDFGFTVSFHNKNNEAFEEGITIPLVSDANIGLMSPSDLGRIANLETTSSDNADSIVRIDNTLEQVTDKLSSIEEYAERNDITEIRVDSTPLQITEEGDVRAVNIALTEKIKEVVGIQEGTVYVFQGSLPNYSDLNNIEAPLSGHVYNIVSISTVGENVYPAGTNFAWNGSEWDALGGVVNLEPLESAIAAINSTLTTYGNRLNALENSVGTGSGDGALTSRVSTLETKVDVLEGDISQEGSVINTSTVIATSIVEDALTWKELE